MIGWITVLLACQLAGEGAALVLGLPVPGPVIGMVVLFIGLLVRGLLVRGDVPEGLRDATGGLLRHLSLLFVPAGAGVATHLTRLEGEALPIAAALVLSTLAALLATGWVMRLLGREG